MNENSNAYVCVMAGGSGERFWPMSRQRTPKHLLKLFSHRTMLENTLLRLEQVVPRENVFVLTNEAQLAETRAALPDFPAAQILVEPAKRDTAAAAALATGLVRARNPDAVVALLPADHLIKDTARFAAQLAAALTRAASTTSLLTFAIRPTGPSPAFGYLEMGRELARTPALGEVRRVQRFVEKPDVPTAEGYLAKGGYAWNAGMFVWRVQSFLAEAERHAPALAAFMREFPAGDPGKYLAERFPLLPKISVDYAIMEKAPEVETVLAEFDWDDVGMWTSLPPHLQSDQGGNAIMGSVVTERSKNNVAISNGRTVALVGVSDLVVVETADAVLVCHRDSVQDIKKIMPSLPKELL